MKNKIKSLFNKKHMAAMIIVFAAILFYIVLQNFEKVGDFISKIVGYLSPLIIGIVIAYLLNPATSFFANKCFKKFKSKKAANALSVAITVILLILILVFLISVIIPEVYHSVLTLVNNFGNYMNTFKDFLNKINEAIPIVDVDVDKLIGSWDTLLDKFVLWIEENYNDIIKVGVNVGSALLNFVLGFIIAVYMLLDKDRMMAAISRFFKLTLKPNTYSNLREKVLHIHNVMIKYITTEITDSLIVLVANYVFMLIFDMPYALLVSVIVGVTNLIPNFGPFIGGIPSVLLILIINPMDAVIFGIWTIGLQFIDGNAIRPMLLGDSLGLSPVVVLVSITVGGQMFGIPGMVLATPAVSVIMYILEESLQKKEAKTVSEQVADVSTSGSGVSDPISGEATTAQDPKMAEHVVSDDIQVDNGQDKGNEH